VVLVIVAGEMGSGVAGRAPGICGFSSFSIVVFFWIYLDISMSDGDYG
jgi:uncharacterized membrane protein YtjA (UPF0391 family)